MFGDAHPSSWRVARPEPADHPTPIEMLSTILREALAQPPCFIEFSGGRDSSLLLAHAVRIARTEGLRSPIALTLRYPADDVDADESAWQELVIGHLNELGHRFDWERRPITDELDLLGPHTLPLLEARRAPFFPPAAGAMLYDCKIAAGGTLVSGEFGDELFDDSRSAILAAAWRQRSVRAVGRRWVGYALAPRLFSSAVFTSARAPWLRPAAERRLRRLDRKHAPHERRWDWQIRRIHASRVMHLYGLFVDVASASAGCRVVHPFMDARMLDSWIAHSPRAGHLRHHALQLLGSDLLPTALIRRTDKATFDRSRFGPHTRRFAREWSGSGVDHRLVDPDRLRASWLSDTPDLGTALLLHQAWLADHTP